jgi:hypothetical protein
MVIEMSWEKHRRDDAQTDASTPAMSFRKTGIAFNAELVRLAHANQLKRATLYFDSEAKRVGVEFHGRTKDRDAYAVTLDGGGSGKAGGRWIQVSRIYQTYPWLGAILKQSTARRRFHVRLDDSKNLWFADVVREKIA